MLSAAPSLTLSQHVAGKFEAKCEWGFDLLVIVEANGEKLPPILALLSSFEEWVQAVEIDCCPFGGIGENWRHHRRFESKWALVLPDKCDRLWMFAGNGNSSSYGVDAVLHIPFFTIPQLGSFVNHFIQKHLRKDLFLVCIFCLNLLQEGGNRQLISLLLGLLKWTGKLFLTGSITQNLLIFQFCFFMLKIKLYLCENFRQIGQ